MSDNWPIIVGGCHRSGTTLFRRILNGHSAIFCPPEIKLHRDLFGQYLNDPHAHARLGASIKALGLPEDVWVDEFTKALIRCYEIAAAKAGKRRWADKNPENALNAAHWDRTLGGKLFFIMIIRHPFDTVASMCEAKMDKAVPDDLTGKAKHVATYIESGLKFIEQATGRSAIVRYEELVGNSEAALKPVLDLIGEEFEPAMTENIAAPAHGHGLEDPKIHKRQNITAESIGRWKNDFSPADKTVLNAALGSLVDKLGYEK